MSDPENTDPTPDTASTQPPSPDTNGAAHEVPEEQMQVSAEVLPYVEFVKRWVAIQFRVPYALIDAVAVDPQPDAKGNVYGIPGPKTTQEGGVVPQSILVGMLDISRCGTALALLLRSPETGAVMRLTFSPKDVAYHTVVARLPPPPEPEKRILVPGSN